MALKVVLDTQESIPEALRDHYVEKDGKWILEAEMDGLRNLFQGEITDLQTALESERTSRRSFEAIAKKWESLDFDEVTTLIKTQQDARDKKMIDAGKVDELVTERVEAINAKFEEDLAAKDVTIGELEGIVSVTVVDAAITAAAVESGVRKESLPIVLSQARSAGWGRDGEKAVLKVDGGVVYGKEPNQPKTPKEWIEDDLLKLHPYLAEPSTGAGTTGEGGGGGGGTTGSKPAAQMTIAEKVDWIAEHSQEEWEAKINSEVAASNEQGQTEGAAAA